MFSSANYCVGAERGGFLAVVGCLGLPYGLVPWICWLAYAERLARAPLVLRSYSADIPLIHRCHIKSGLWERAKCFNSSRGPVTFDHSCSFDPVVPGVNQCYSFNAITGVADGRLARGPSRLQYHSMASDSPSSMVWEGS